MLRENLEYNKNVKANSAFLEELKLKLPEFFTAEKKDDDGNIVEESKFDYLKFKKMLDEQNIEEFTSGYQLDFIGKNYAKKQSGERPNTVIVPDIEHNTKMENKNSKNIFLTGDNLEVLRHLQQNYQNSVDFIYIDPPYNTGKDDFIYPDNFEYTDEELSSIFGLTNEELKKLKSIQGRSSHSSWLAFMYPRLYLAKKILKDSGVIFVSIDDNENYNLYLLMTEIFGENSFVANMVIDGTPKNDPMLIATSHEYMLVFVKNVNYAKDEIWGSINEHTETILNLVRDKSFIDAEKDLKIYYEKNKLLGENIANYKYVDSKGVYRIGPIDDPQSKGSRDTRINIKTGNPLKIPKRGWSCNIETWNEWVLNDLIQFPEDDENLPAKKTYLTFDKYEVGRSVIKMQTRSSTNYLKSLFNNKNVFKNAKPINLLKQIITLMNVEQPIILDFFAGSGTTADAVMQLNAEDGGNRKFILCTLPEKTYTVNADGTEIPTKGGAVAYEAGYKSIDEISRERIKRAAEKIKQENPEIADSLDLGFKHYRVVSPSVETLEDIEFNDVMQLDLLEDMISKFSSENLGVDGNATGIDTILQTYLVQDGYKFDVNIEYIELGEYKVPYINNQRIYIISNNWNNKATEKLVNIIGRNEIQVQTIVVYGYSFDAKNLRTLEYALNQLDNKVNLQIRY